MDADMDADMDANLTSTSFRKPIQEIYSVKISLFVYNFSLIPLNWFLDPCWAITQACGLGLSYEPLILIIVIPFFFLTILIF